jgi:hypothetical protein
MSHYPSLQSRMETVGGQSLGKGERGSVQLREILSVVVVVGFELRASHSGTLLLKPQPFLL